jgi:SOS-response transcriptional repressor LexA
VTPLQHRCLETVRAYIAEKGYSPSLREIARGIGIALSGTAAVVNALVDRGHLVRTSDKTRNLRLPEVPTDLRAQLLAALLPFKNTMPLVKHDHDDTAIEDINTDLAVDDIKRAAAAYDALIATPTGDPS